MYFLIKLYVSLKPYYSISQFQSPWSLRFPQAWGTSSKRQAGGSKLLLVLDRLTTSQILWRNEVTKRFRHSISFDGIWLQIHEISHPLSSLRVLSASLWIMGEVEVKQITVRLRSWSIKSRYTSRLPGRRIKHIDFLVATWLCIEYYSTIRI